MAVQLNFKTKNRGAALLIIVLIGFLVLSIVSGVAITIAWQTSRVEAWQTQNMQKRRMDFLARSTADMIIETISLDKDAASFDSIDNLNTGITSYNVLTLDNAETTAITAALRRNSEKNYTITVTASPDQGQQVTLSANMVNSGDSYIISWRNGK